MRVSGASMVKDRKMQPKGKEIYGHWDDNQENNAGNPVLEVHGLVWWNVSSEM